MKCAGDLIADLYRISRYVPTGNRIRLLVSAEEYEVIREFMLKSTGSFYGRIGGVAMLVVDEPEADPIWFEVASLEHT